MFSLFESERQSTITLEALKITLERI